MLNCLKWKFEINLPDESQQYWSISKKLNSDESFEFFFHFYIVKDLLLSKFSQITDLQDLQVLYNQFPKEPTEGRTEFEIIVPAKSLSSVELSKYMFEILDKLVKYQDLKYWLKYAKRVDCNLKYESEETYVNKLKCLLPPYAQYLIIKHRRAFWAKQNELNKKDASEQISKISKLKLKSISIYSKEQEDIDLVTSLLNEPESWDALSEVVLDFQRLSDCLLALKLLSKLKNISKIKLSYEQSDVEDEQIIIRKSVNCLKKTSL